MKTQFIILTLACAFLSSCSSYEVRSAQNQEHADYSTWNHQPKNS